jgi:ParB family chromosome partitioning protein
MSEAKRGLGRGLSSLLGDAPQGGGGAGDGVQTLAVAAIYPNPDQPRRHFDDDALDELAESLKEKGLLQPIIVRPKGDGYEIIAGERRWRAAQRARLHQIPALVRSVGDGETLELAIIENIQRQNLNAIEEAQAYQRLATEYGHSQEALGKIVGKSRSHVANLLRLLDLPPPVRAMVADGRLSMGHARALITAADPAGLAEEVIRRGLSVRDTEALAKRSRGAAVAPTRKPSPAGDADTQALERQLGDLVGLKVTIAHGAGGGAVTLHYSTLDQLDMICQRLNGGAI